MAYTNTKIRISILLLMMLAIAPDADRDSESPGRAARLSLADEPRPYRLYAPRELLRVVASSLGARSVDPTTAASAVTLGLRN